MLGNRHIRYSNGYRDSFHRLSPNQVVKLLSSELSIHAASLGSSAEKTAVQPRLGSGERAEKPIIYSRSALRVAAAARALSWPVDAAAFRGE
jgi:hypothetical protein